MSSVLLTGAGGLVGSRLLPRLLDAGFSVRALIRRDIELPTGAVAIRGDLADPDSLRDAVDGVDAVVHFAAIFRTQDERAIWAANLDGTRNLVEAVERYAPSARFIMASTSNVYDDDATHPGREDDECSPTAAYPASKLAAETLLRRSGLTWSVLRLPFVYGDGDGHIEALPPLVGRFGYHPAKVFSVGHHRDVAAAVRLALSGATDGRVINVADDAPVTIYELTRIAGAPVEESGQPLEHPWSGRVDTTAIRDLGLQPEVPSVHAAAGAGLL